MAPSLVIVNPPILVESVDLYEHGIQYPIDCRSPGEQPGILILRYASKRNAVIYAVLLKGANVD